MAAIRVPSSGSTRHPSGSGFFWDSDWQRVCYTYYIEGDLNSSGNMVYKITFSIYLRYESTWMGVGHVIGAKFTVGGVSKSITVKDYNSTWSGKSYSSSVGAYGPYATKSISVEVPITGTSLSWSLEWNDTGRANSSDITPLTEQSRGKASGTIGVANGPSPWTISSSEIDLDTTLVIRTTPTMSTNYHKFTATYGTKTYSWTSNFDTYCELSMSASKFGSWFGTSVSELPITLTMTTYNSSDVSLGSSSNTINLKMTSAVGAPTGLAVTHSSTAKGTVKFTITAPTTKYGATISSYTCTSSIGSASRSGTTVTVTIPSNASSSSLSLSVVATDSRGFTATASKSVTYNGASLCAIVSDIWLDDSVQVTVDEWVASNTITIAAATKNSSGTATKKTFVTKSTSNAIMCNFSAADFGYLFPSNSKTATATVTFTTDNSGGTSQGNHKTTVDLTMPESVGKPTGMKLTIASASNTQIKITVTPPSYKYGASLSKYTATTSSGKASVSGNTITVTNSNGFGNGKVTISVYATDTRGFKTDTISIEKLNTVPKIVFGGASYEKVCVGSSAISAIYLGTTKVM